MDKLRERLIKEVSNWIDTSVIAEMVASHLGEQGTPLTAKNCQDQWLSQIEKLAGS